MSVKDSERIDTPERALLSLFKKPALDFSRKLRVSLDADPQYLDKHRSEVAIELACCLKRAGVVLDASTSEEELLHLVREVVVRLRSYEKVGGGTIDVH